MTVSEGRQRGRQAVATRAIRERCTDDGQRRERSRGMRGDCRDSLCRKELPSRRPSAVIARYQLIK